MSSSVTIDPYSSCSPHYDAMPSLKEMKTGLIVAGIVGVILASITASPAVAHAINSTMLQAMGSGLIASGLIFGPLLLKREKQHAQIMTEIDAAIENKSINQQDETTGETLLHKAARLNDVEAIELIISHGGNTEICNKEGQTPLALAAFCGSQQAFEYLDGLPENMMQEIYNAKRTNSLNQKDENGETLLHKAVRLGYTKAIQSILSLGGDADIADNLGRTPLHWAAATLNDVDILQSLIENGGDVEATDNEKRMPLHLAALHSHREAYFFLLTATGQPDALDQDNRSPLDLWRESLLK